ncbi:META domain-containing protein [Aquisalimonas sp.]|uniref:META domain-containing protein n=1 Tax=unclassified Aquisalimonas TaxID=2644645 RepID=UPI0025C04166|nr:META domain-containing protein [Aquisalimonas sp.]
MRVRSTLFLTGVLLAGCATDPQPDTVRPVSMDEPPEALVGDWRVVGAVDPQGRYLEPDAVSFSLEIADDGQVAGSAACNSWNAQVEHVDDDHLRFGAIGLTRAACQIQDPDARAFEDLFVTNLTRTMEWSRSSDTLVLRFQDGQEWELTAPD